MGDVVDLPVNPAASTQLQIDVAEFVKLMTEEEQLVLFTAIWNVINPLHRRRFLDVVSG